MSDAKREWYVDGEFVREKLNGGQRHVATTNEDAPDDAALIARAPQLAADLLAAQAELAKSDACAKANDDLLQRLKRKLDVEEGANGLLRLQLDAVRAELGEMFEALSMIRDRECECPTMSMVLKREDLWRCSRCIAHDALERIAKHAARGEK